MICAAPHNKRKQCAPGGAPDAASRAAVAVVRAHVEIRSEFMLQWNSARMVAGLVYGVVFLVSVVWFEIRANLIIEVQGLWLPYLAVILIASLLGAYFSSLYLRDGNSFRYYAVVCAVPVAITIASGTLAGVAYILSGEVAGVGASTMDAVTLVLYSALVFIYGALPVLCIGLVMATVFLVRKYGRANGEGAL